MNVIVGLVFLLLSATFYAIAGAVWQVESAALTMSALFGLLALIAFSMRKELN